MIDKKFKEKANNQIKTRDREKYKKVRANIYHSV